MSRARCTFADQLAELLDDGTGRIRPELVPLAKHLLAMNNSKSGLSWLRPSHRPARPPAVLLQELGRGEIELTYEAFQALQPWRAAAHLRELLMACGVLPVVDKQICTFERWVIVHLASVADPEHAQLVRRFVTWEVLPRLRARADRKPLTPAIRRDSPTASRAPTTADSPPWPREPPDWNAPTTTCHGNSPTSYVNHNLKGPFEDNWQFIDDIEVGAIVYKPCDEDRNFNINTELRAAVGTSDPKKTTSFGLPTRTQASE